MAWVGLTQIADLVIVYRNPKNIAVSTLEAIFGSSGMAGRENQYTGEGPVSVMFCCIVREWPIASLTLTVFVETFRLE